MYNIIITRKDGSTAAEPYEGALAGLRRRLAEAAAEPGVSLAEAYDDDGNLVDSCRAKTAAGEQYEIKWNDTATGNRRRKVFRGSETALVRELRRMMREEGIKAVRAVDASGNTVMELPRKQRARTVSADGTRRVEQVRLNLNRAAARVLDLAANRGDYAISAILQKYAREHGENALRALLEPLGGGTAAILTDTRTGGQKRVTASLWHPESRDGVPVWTDADGNAWWADDKNIIITKDIQS